MKFLLMILLVFNLIACSGSKVAKDAENAANEGLADEVGLEDEGSEFAADDELAAADETSTEDSSEEMADDASANEDVVSEEVVQEDISPSEPAVEDVSSNMAPAPSMEMSGANGVYTVRPGDTLMLIAFKVYRDYSKWRKIANKNSGKLGPNNSVSVGMQLMYDEPAEKIAWNPQGNPYLIRGGDTLGSISKDTYGTMSYWKNIWHNNEPLIKNPNKIFAGFTIYTPVIESRDVANEEI